MSSCKRMRGGVGVEGVRGCRVGKSGEVEGKSWEIERKRKREGLVERLGDVDV